MDSRGSKVARAARWVSLSATLLAAACSAGSETSIALDPAPDAGSADASFGPAATRVLPAETGAVTRVEALRARFVHAATDSGQRASLVPVAEASAILLDEGRLVPKLPVAVNHAANALRAMGRFAPAADGPWTIGWRGVEADVTLRGAAATKAKSAGGALVYEGALPGATLVHVPGWTGTEELIHFEERPAEPVLRYDVATRGAAGFRLYDGTFELLDADGYPRLRTTAPTVLDAAGTTRRGTIAVEGCAYDTSERAPWGRPLTPPGSERCTVTIAWDDRDLVYPLLVDPPWTNTAGLAQKRAQHTANALTSNANATCSGGCVLAVGGYNAGGLASTELYSVTGGTWTTIGANPVARWNHTATTTLEPNQRVVVAGGCTVAPCWSTTASTYTWDPVSLWVSRGDLPGGARGYLASTSVSYNANPPWNYDSYVSGGEAGAGVGGMSTKALDVFHAGANTWSAASPMSFARSRHAMNGWTPGCGGSCVPQPILVVAGGRSAPATVLNTVEYWDGGWKASGNLANAAYSLTTALAGGVVYFAGGVAGGGGFVSDIHATPIGTPANVSKIGLLSAPRGYLAGTTFGTSPARPIFIGGEQCATGSDGSEVADIADATGLLGSNALNQPRTQHGTVRLPDGSAMVVGGVFKSCANVCCNTSLSYPTYEEIFTPGKKGGACTQQLDCQSSLYCVDGVCCDTPCTGLCQACSAGKTGGASGTCASVKAGTDPDDECTAAPTTSCKENGVCDGLGACQLWGTSTTCAQSSCVGGTLTEQKCNGTGSCVGSNSSCGAYSCNGTTACFTSCTADAQCAQGHYCTSNTGGICVAKKAQGEGCAGDSVDGTGDHVCSNGNCVDDVCCDAPCTGACQACSAAKKGAGADGVCGNIAAGSDPDDDCADEGATSCKHDGECDGSGTCRVYAQGVACGDTTCQGNLVKGLVCNGAGSCVTDSSGVDCAPYVCKGTGCANPCANDGDCASGNFCDKGACTPKAAAGQACAAASQCDTGFCAPEGVCCDTACTGQCEACDVAGSLGTCAPVKGAPHAKRSACSTDGSSCGGACNGVSRDACIYPSATTVCGSTCEDAQQTDSLCDGHGSCVVGQPKACPKNLACDGATKCKTTCTAKADCASGFVCDKGQCAPPSQATCDGDHTATTGDGKPIDCTPYRCDANGSCKDKCASIDDCVAPAVCDTDGRCVPPVASADASSEEGGCGCRVAGRSGSERTYGIALLVASLGVIARVRRRARAPRRA